jgi:hypothetical protein
LADWAARAAVQAVKANPKGAGCYAVHSKAWPRRCSRKSLLILGDVAEDKQYFAQLHAKLDERFAARLGLQVPKAN